MKKTPARRLSKTKTESRTTADTWHNGGDTEILQYARSLQKAATTLVGKLELDQSSRTAWDVCPVVSLYRQALEIHLKMLVGEGSKFLASPTDPISLSTTHSLRWLAQIVCQIIKKVGWQREFKCLGVSSLAEFSVLVNDVEGFDPVARSIRSAETPNSVSEFYRDFDILTFAANMDALLTLLTVTSDALAATWDLQEDATAGAEFGSRDDVGQTIQ